ncbi:MAG: hypothetical protein QOF83_1368 [Solirubrobacteraceae bacterium]|jgi:hypothetical protein|nr:hypothetical protein [Solirubrobacteraceae bacterium]
MKSRLATVFTLLALVGGSGGALAVAGSSGHESSHGAANSEYRPGKGCGDRNHEHTGSRGKDKQCPSHEGHHGDHGDHGNHGDGGDSSHHHRH